MIKRYDDDVDGRRVGRGPAWAGRPTVAPDDSSHGASSSPAATTATGTRSATDLEARFRSSSPAPSASRTCSAPSCAAAWTCGVQALEYDDGTLTVEVDPYRPASAAVDQADARHAASTAPLRTACATRTFIPSPRRSTRELPRPLRESTPAGRHLRRWRCTGCSEYDGDLSARRATPDDYATAD